MKEHFCNTNLVIAVKSKEKKYMALLRTTQVIIVLLLRTILLQTLGSNIEPIKQGQNCSQPQKCGNLNIPYPFGTKEDGCYLNEEYVINCDTSHNPPIPFLGTSNVTVMKISIDTHGLQVQGLVARDCYNEYGNLTSSGSRTESSFVTNSSFPISVRNKFTAVGCDTNAEIAASRGVPFGLVGNSICESFDTVQNGSCLLPGCLQFPIIQYVWDYKLTISSFEHHKKVNKFNPCGFAFVVEEESYNFSALDLKTLMKRETFPLVLDWFIVNQTCQEAKKNQSTYACKAENSKCSNSVNGFGYQCYCPHGYEGNPYMLDGNGCTDIDECKTQEPCSIRCHNLLGSYKCSCPFGFKGDGVKGGTGCRPNYAVILTISFGVFIALSGIFTGVYGILWRLKKQKLRQLKEEFFRQNGGLLLQQQILALKESVERPKIFTAEDLENATNKFDKSKILGQGGTGTVYKGVLPTDNKMVAIKKSKLTSQDQIEQFINEVVVLSQINHRNIVKLLGCCLETEVPVLVYEFITDGTLSDHIHNGGVNYKYPSLSWTMRLKIATEAAGALAYLHSSTSMPIIHRDVKTTNILLNENYTTKIADFGASKLVPLDQSQLTTLVQGTLGYLDPEYMQTGQLNEKSDVYSFGVVLAELLTSKKAISFERSEENINLAAYFLSFLKQGRLLEILDNQVVVEGSFEDVKVVARVVKNCLRVRVEDRPTMKEVAMELEGVYNKNKHPWIDNESCSEETEYLLNLQPYKGGDSLNLQYDNTENKILVKYGGR